MSSVGVLDKAVAVLGAFTPDQMVLEPKEISARVGLPLGTVYRLCQALAEHRLLEREGSGYRLGLGLVHLGARAAEGIDLRRVVRPHLEWLRDRTGENAELHICHGAARVSVELVPSRQNLRPMAEVGAPLPLQVGASGKVLLAALSPEAAERLARDSRAQFGGSPVEPLALARALARARARGWADSDGERSPGIAAVAAPIRGAAGEVVGVVVVSGPSARLTARRRREAASAVVEAATRASADLGHRDAEAFLLAHSRERATSA